MGVAIYAKSIIPRTILASPTSYILNLCILPTKDTDGFDHFTNLEPSNKQVESLGEYWIKFRNYALINRDQVILTVDREIVNLV